MEKGLQCEDWTRASARAGGGAGLGPVPSAGASAGARARAGAGAGVGFAANLLHANAKRKPSDVELPAQLISASCG